MACAQIQAQAARSGMVVLGKQSGKGLRFELEQAASRTASLISRSAGLDNLVTRARVRTSAQLASKGFNRALLARGPVELTAFWRKGLGLCRTLEASVTELVKRRKLCRPWFWKPVTRS